MKPKVSNPWDVPNQFIIRTKDGEYFQSYDSIIVYRPNEGKLQLGKNWKYSKTTSKYRSLYLNGETTAETVQHLEDGTYVLNEDL